MNNRLEEIRKKKGITQEELASALEVSRQTIGSLENGKYNPSIILAFKIANFFSLTIEDIFIYEEGKENEKNNFKNIVFMITGFILVITGILLNIKSRGSSSLTNLSFCLIGIGFCLLGHFLEEILKVISLKNEKDVKKPL